MQRSTPGFFAAQTHVLVSTARGKLKKQHADSHKREIRIAGDDARLSMQRSTTGFSAALIHVLVRTAYKD
jgi:hypothetical protein